MKEPLIECTRIGTVPQPSPPTRLGMPLRVKELTLEALIASEPVTLRYDLLQYAPRAHGKGMAGPTGTTSSRDDLEHPVDALYELLPIDPVEMARL